MHRQSYPAFAHIVLRENPGKKLQPGNLPRPGIEPGPPGFAARRISRYTTGSVADEPLTGQPRISAQTVETVQNANERSSQASTRRLSLKLALPRTSICKVLRFTPKRRTYDLQVVHKLDAED
ncbi:hypothetical protein ANN_26019 [Periplaneta americana]|uniref:Uncharacterized protein n=1 Tax=Periplaneta americana TaxID=6978 RepID=A0ABQ8S4Z6_PERAM|nr:hypothetical protein ANN_26019 [Periplaneta americana]